MFKTAVAEFTFTLNAPFPSVVAPVLVPFTKILTPGMP